MPARLLVRSRRCPRGCRACQRATAPMPIARLRHAVAERSGASTVLLQRRRRRPNGSPSLLRVVLAHESLQLGKLADHQVSRSHLPAQRRGARRPAIGRRSIRRCAPRGQPHALAPCRAASRASPETSRSLSIGRPALRAARARSLFQKNCGVGEPRTHHALVAVAHSCADHGSRCWRLRRTTLHQLAVSVAHREVALVVPHRRDRQLPAAAAR